MATNDGKTSDLMVNALVWGVVPSSDLANYDDHCILIQFGIKRTNVSLDDDHMPDKSWLQNRHAVKKTRP